MPTPVRCKNLGGRPRSPGRLIFWAWKRVKPRRGFSPTARSVGNRERLPERQSQDLGAAFVGDLDVMFEVDAALHKRGTRHLARIPYRALASGSRAGQFAALFVNNV